MREQSQGKTAYLNHESFVASAAPQKLLCARRGGRKARKGWKEGWVGKRKREVGRHS